MAIEQTLDVIVVGGGLAGSAIGGVLARAGLGVLVIEKEANFRDRVRGEAIWPWGVVELARLGLMDLLRATGCVDVTGIALLAGQQIMDTIPWEAEPMVGFSHPDAQEALLAWAISHGAVVLRSAKVTGLAHHGGPVVTVQQGDEIKEFRGRLVVGADGRLSSARRWIGAETVGKAGPFRFGGVVVAGALTTPYLEMAMVPGAGVYRFGRGVDSSRLYLYMHLDHIRATGVDRSFTEFTGYAAGFLPEGALEGARQDGPIGFFQNDSSWSSAIAAEGVVLIGDAAGRSEPSGGFGTSLLFRDVRELSDLLLNGEDWEAAIIEFARRRTTYYTMVRTFDSWETLMYFDVGDEADQRRAKQARAAELDPTLGGIALFGMRGPDGFVPDEATRRSFFGEA